MKVILCCCFNWLDVFEGGFTVIDRDEWEWGVSRIEEWVDEQIEFVSELFKESCWFWLSFILNVVLEDDEDEEDDVNGLLLLFLLLCVFSSFKQTDSFKK